MIRRLRHSGVSRAAATALACLFLLAGGPGRAQDHGVPDDGTLEARFLNCAKVRSTPDVRDKLLQVEKALRDQRWNEALSLFVELTEQYPSDVVKTGPGRYIGVRDAVLQRMRDLPPEAEAAFRDVFDPRIERELNQAVERRDLLQLRRIGFDMFLSTHSDTALMRLLELQIERGLVEAAVETGETLRDRQLQRGDLKSGLAARLGELYALRGDEAALGRLRALVHQSGENVAVRGKLIPLVEYLARLTVRETARREYTERGVWRRFGGDLDNNLFVDGAIDLAARKWRCDVPNQLKSPGARHAQIIRSSGAIIDRSRETEVYAPLHPVTMDNLVYLHSNDQVFCYNLFTSRMHWSWKTDDVSAYYYEDENSIFTSQLYKDLLIVAIETPYLDDLPMYSNTFFVKPYVPDRHLVAFNRFTGEIVWEQKENTAHPKIRRCSYPLPPVEYNDRLYVIATTEIGENVTQSLVCLDPENGKCLWTLELCNGMAESNMFGRNLRESAPMQPVIVDNLFIYGTNYGAVIAVDLSSHDVEWISYYPVAPIPRAQGLELKWRLQRWAPNPVVHDDGRLFVAAVDSNDLLAFDAATGELLWNRQRDSGEKYVLGTRDGKVLVSGYTLYALDARTGRKEWETLEPVSLGGRGQIAGNSVWVPGERTLDRFDLVDGRRISSQQWSKPSDAGNLLILPGDITLVSGAGHDGQAQTIVHYDIKKLEAALLKGITDNPEDPVAHYELGSIYNQSGQSMKAIDALLKGKSLAEKNPEAWQTLLGELRSLLYRAYADAGAEAWKNKDAANAETYLTRAREYASAPAEHIDVMLQLDGMFKELGKADERVVVYEDMLQNFPRENYQFPGFEADAGLYALLQLTLLHSTREGKETDALECLHKLNRRYSRFEIYGQPVGQYAYERIQAMIQKHGVGVYRHLAEQADALLQQGTAESLQILLREFPNYQKISEAMNALGVALRESGDVAEYSAALRGFVRAYPRSEGALYGLARLVESYEAQGYYSNARAVLLRMQRDFPDKRVELDGVAVSVQQLLNDKLALPAYRAAGNAAYPWTMALPVASAGQPIELKQGAMLLQPQGMHPLLEGRVCTGEVGLVKIFSASGGEPLMTVQLPRNEQPMRLFIENDLMIVLCQTTVYAVNLDALQANPAAAIAWARTFSGGLRDAAAQNGLLLLNQVPRGLSTTLVALDLNTGETLWEKELQRIAESPLLISSLCGVYVMQSSIYIIDLLTGEPLDKYSNSLGEGTEPVTVGQRKIALTVSQRQGNRIECALVCFDTVEGRRLWQAPLPDSVKTSDMICGDGDTVCVSLKGRRAAACYDADNGTLLWNRDMGDGKIPQLILGQWMLDESLYQVVKEETRAAGKLITTMSLRKSEPRSGKTVYEKPFADKENDGLEISFVRADAASLFVKTRSYSWKTHTNSYHLYFLSRANGASRQDMEAFTGEVGETYTFHADGMAVLDQSIVSFYKTKDR